MGGGGRGSNIDRFFVVYPEPYLAREPPRLTPSVCKSRVGPSILTAISHCTLDLASPGSPTSYPTGEEV